VRNAVMARLVWTLGRGMDFPDGLGLKGSGGAVKRVRRRSRTRERVKLPLLPHLC
jgi:hypothetical protein